VLRKETPELRAALLSRAARTFADVTRIGEMEAAGTALSIHPPADGPLVSRLTTDGTVLAAAFESGREAAHDRLGGSRLPHPAPRGSSVKVSKATA
jgi:hypothetical protein